MIFPILTYNSKICGVYAKPVLGQLTNRKDTPPILQTFLEVNNKASSTAFHILSLKMKNLSLSILF